MSDAEFFERVVREVVRRLRELQRPAGPPNGAAPKTQLRVEQRVVTAAALRGRLDGVQELHVLPQAIVTPLVRDELRERNIALIRAGNDG